MRARSLGGALLAATVVAALLAPLTSAEVSQKQGVRVSVEGGFAPKRLPRTGTAPISVSVDGKIGGSQTDGPPQLQTIRIAINREGRLDTRGLPICRIGQIDPSTSQEALETCESSLVGEGTFSANVKIPEQSPFPSEGKILAFNGRLGGKPALLAHIFGSQPIPTSYVLPFTISASHGTFGTVLEASLPKVTGEWGYVTGVEINLGRRFSFGGKQRSYLSASCPAPAGFPGAVFPLLRTDFTFVSGLSLSSTLSRSCQVKG
jgi:hypothetical protein